MPNLKRMSQSLGVPQSIPCLRSGHLKAMLCRCQYHLLVRDSCRVEIDIWSSPMGGCQHWTPHMTGHFRDYLFFFSHPWGSFDSYPYLVHQGTKKEDVIRRCGVFLQVRLNGLMLKVLPLSTLKHCVGNVWMNRTIGVLFRPRNL